MSDGPHDQVSQAAIELSLSLNCGGGDIRSTYRGSQLIRIIPTAQDPTRRSRQDGQTAIEKVTDDESANIKFEATRIGRRLTSDPATAQPGHRGRGDQEDTRRRFWNDVDVEV